MRPKLLHSLTDPAMVSTKFVSLVVLSVVAANCFLCSATRPTAAQQTALNFSLDSPPTDLQVSPFDASIVVSAGQKLHLLNPDFSLNSSVVTHDGQDVHRIALSFNTSDVVLACKDSFCTHYDIDWIDSQFYTHKTVGRGFDSIPLSIDPDGYYVGTSDSVSMNVLQIDQDGNTLRDYEVAFRNSNFYKRQFLHGFRFGDFVYFVVRDNGTNSSNNVRIMRLCHDLEVYAFTAAYEAVLECSAMTANSKVEVSQSLMDEFGNAVITFSVNTDQETNICSFFLNDINAEMDSSYSICSSRENNTLTIPLAWYYQRTCTIFSTSVIDMCDFDLVNQVSSVPSLASFNSVSGRHLLRLNSSEEVTAVLTGRVGIRTTTDLLFVALSTSHEGHFLYKYHITGEGGVRYVSREQHSSPITLLRWNELMQEIYGGNANSVFGVPLERCSNYTTCSGCTTSGDPLCGWCALGQYCSQSVNCPSSSRQGHWVDSRQQCIASLSLTRASMAIDLIQSVELMVVPAEASLPSSPPQDYQCSFYHGSRENTSYSLTVPFTGGACQLQLAQIHTFHGAHIDLNFTLQLGSSGVEPFLTSSVLVLHNCSLRSDCGSCVEASESCGWCVYDRICTGNPSECRHGDDWRSLPSSDENGVCPVVVIPDHGSYTLPVAVRRQIILSTFNIPTEIPGYEYECRIRYENGTSVELAAEYYNHTEFRCLTTENQVHMSPGVTNGSEAIQLEILWRKSSDNSSVILHSIKLTLYDCVRLGSDCSSCLSANIMTGFQCVWCDKLNIPDACTVIDDCLTQSTLFSDIANCPLPTITGISPESGPTMGGTVLMVNGTNLGAVATDVTVELVETANQIPVNRVPCTVDHTRYIPGTQVVCTTSEATEGPHLVSVSVHRGAQTARPLTLTHTFTYAHPIINSVEPKQGPKAGGTHIVFLGSNLDVGSPGAARVFIGDVPCDIQMVAPTVISCVSRPVPTTSDLQRTRIVIDNADMPSELYNYTENPVFDRVEPQNIIPAGGVTLTFRGSYLDVVLSPELIVTIDNHTFVGACRAGSSSTLKCTAPKLPTLYPTSNGVQQQRSLSRIPSGTINYTVTMDGADGPRSDRDGLQIVVKPDPIFFMLHIEDKEYTLESGRSIRILGSNVDSVLPSELSVVIDDATCTLVNDDISDTQIRCFPPDTVLPGDRLVKVYVGKSGLNYSVGFIRYTKSSSSGSNYDYLIIIMPTLTGVIVLMVVVLAILFCSIGITIRKKRAYKARQRSTALHEEDKSGVAMVPVFTNVYNGSRHAAGEHDYDTIPDVLEQMQLQQIEMITCAAQQELPLTDISPTAKRSGNIYYSEDEGRGTSAGSSRNRSSSASSRPTSGSLSGSSRPHSSSTSGSLSYNNVKRPPLPPLPTSMSDEYVAMHSYSAGTCSPEDAALDKTGLPLTTATATVEVHDPSSSSEPEKVMVGEGYDKLEPKKGETEAAAAGEGKREKLATDITAVVLPDRPLVGEDTIA